MASKTKKLNPAAFLSYVRFDDKHEDGKISELRERLSSEVRAQTGDEFPIFQDRNDILWGENWEQRIDKSINASTFLIPIVTPSFFKSPSCRKEIEQFLKREKRLKRNDLILPIYYIDSSSQVEPEGTAKRDKVAEIIFSRQYADWRELRPELITSPQAVKILIQMAQQVRDAILRSTGIGTGSRKRRRKPTKPQSSIKKSEDSGSLTAAIDVEQTPPDLGAQRLQPIAKTEPPTRVVDLMYRGDYTSITEAIEAANPGDRILIRPGLYEERLVINKPGLEIVGDGPLGDIVIRAKETATILFKTTMGRLSNLRVQQVGTKWFAVQISQGRLEMEDCDISSEGLSGVAVLSGSDPRLRRNRIHNCKQAGLFVYDQGQGIFEDNDIFQNLLHGVAVRTGGSPTFRRNRIHDNKQLGIYVFQSGQGTFEDNEIFGNTSYGILVSGGCDPAFRRNRIHDGNTTGIYLQQNSGGAFENNEVFANTNGGVVVETGANPVFRRNLIHDEKQCGILVCKEGQGVFEDNDIAGNIFAGVEIRTGGRPVFRRNRIHDGKQSGIFVNEKGEGTFEENDVISNMLVGVAVRAGGNPTFRRNRINKNGYKGIRIYDGGGGTFEKNDVKENGKGAWGISKDSLKQVKRTGNSEK